MADQTIIGKFLKWRVKHISQSYFMGIMAAVIGLSVGVAAFMIKKAVYVAKFILTSSFTDEYHSLLYILYPMLGILIAVLFMKFILKKQVGHGIPSVLYAISKNDGNIDRHNIFSSVITSAFTVGFGGSVGLEGPTVATGAAIGSNLGRALRLNYRHVILMLGCACAGAMAAIFKAPIAAVIFAVEVIMLDLTMSSIVPLLIASASAALTAYLLMGQNVLYSFDVKEAFKMTEIHYFVLLGVFTGFISVYFTRMYMYVGRFFERFKLWWQKLLIGGIFLGILLFFFPSLYGEGYEVINESLQGDFSHLYNNSIFYGYRDNFMIIMVLFALVLIFKVIATSVTFGSGGIGGIFAPSLFLGSNTGLFFAVAMNSLGANISKSNFAFAGMAGAISGIIHAPLTGIFLIAEITGGYKLFMPLMITSIISYITMRIFESNSVYTIQLAKRGELLTHDKDKAVLTLMKVNSLIETNFHTVNPDMSLRELVEVISKASRNIFPVIDKDGQFWGIVLLDHIRHIMFRQELYDEVYVRDLYYVPSLTVTPEESMEDVAKKFQVSGNFNIVVLENGKYLGCVSRANVFSTYRKMLKNMNYD